MPKIAAFVVVSLAAGAFVVAGIALAGSAKSVSNFHAAMVAGAEVPKPKAAAGAKGLFTATVTETGPTRTISWKLTFSRLTGKALAAHIHKGKAGVAGGVLVPLCGPCRSGQTGQAKISRAAADALEAGLTYVNVHTTKNAAGEIRGQVKPVQVGTTPPPQATDPTTRTPTPDPGYGGDPGY
jgi:hypothetical protein